MDGRGDTSADPEGLAGGLSAAHCGQDCGRVCESATTAFGVTDGVAQPLTAAWIELDTCRSVLGTMDHPAILGHLELVAALLREAVFNLLLATAKCPPAAVGGAAIERPRGQVGRSAYDTGSHHSVIFPVRQRGWDHRAVKQHRSARATVH